MERLLTEWDAARNAPLTPAAVTHGSHKRVWWRCERGHSYEARVSSRVDGTGCPYCAGRRIQAGENDFAARFPALAAQWDVDRNGNLRPDQVTDSSNRRVWWRCERGHSYRTTVAHRARDSSGCPYCTGRKVLPGFNDLATRAPQIAAQWHPTLNGTLSPTAVTVAAAAKSGGSARSTTPGKPSSMPAPAASKAAAPSAQAKQGRTRTRILY